MFSKLVTSLICMVMFLSTSCVAKPVKKPVAKPAQSQAAPVAGEIAWVNDLAQGLGLAKQSGKPVMTDFYAGWCGWCKKLDAEVYTNKDVIALSQKFVCVKVDSDKNQEDAQKYGVRGLPTIVFMNSEGKASNTVVGYRDSVEFLKEMNKALAK